MGDECLDPQITIELETLNSATKEINELEKELDASQELFRTTLSSTTAELNKLIQKFGQSIELSRPFYVALKEAQSAHRALHETTVLYQRANAIHEEAKLRVDTTEEKLKSGDCDFDKGLQEVLNVAILKVSESSKSKNDFSRLHKQLTEEFTRCEKNLYNLEKKLCKHIQRSQPYFELKDQLNQELGVIKARIQEIQTKLTRAKCSYANSLKKLEVISEEIHRKRQAQRYSSKVDRGDTVNS